MAIVPLAKDVSIKTIRDVINQKAILIGQVRSVGTTYTMYGYDKKTGYVQAHIKNISSSTINITTTLERAGGNVAETFNLAAGATKFLSYTGLKGKTGGYSKGYWTSGNPATSYTGNADYDISIVENSGAGRQANVDNMKIHSKSRQLYYPIIFGNNYSVTNISITTNWNLRDALNQPTLLKDTTNSNNNKLSNWRGSQIIQGTVLTRTSRLGFYGNETKEGFIHVELSKSGFGAGPITVSIRNATISKDITKNISTGNDKVFKFNNLEGNRIYNIYIKDTITGTRVRKKFKLEQVKHNQSKQHKSYSFNGNDQFLAFTF